MLAICDIFSLWNCIKFSQPTCFILTDLSATSNPSIFADYAFLFETLSFLGVHDRGLSWCSFFFQPVLLSLLLLQWLNQLNMSTKCWCSSSSLWSLVCSFRLILLVSRSLSNQPHSLPDFTDRPHDDGSQVIVFSSELPIRQQSCSYSFLLNSSGWILTNIINSLTVGFFSIPFKGTNIQYKKARKQGIFLDICLSLTSQIQSSPTIHFQSSPTYHFISEISLKSPPI